jgi:hypothetical protein
VAWPLPHDELIVSPKMTSFMLGPVQPGLKHVLQQPNEQLSDPFQPAGVA